LVYNCANFENLVDKIIRFFIKILYLIYKSEKLGI